MLIPNAAQGPDCHAYVTDMRGSYSALSEQTPNWQKSQASGVKWVSFAKNCNKKHSGTFLRDHLTKIPIGSSVSQSLGTPFSHRKTGENCQKNTITGYSVYSEQTAIPSILLSGAELTEYYSVHYWIRTGPKRTRLPPIPCILIPE